VISFYKKNGFLILRNVIKAKDIEKIYKRLKFHQKKDIKSARSLSDPGTFNTLINFNKRDEIIGKIVQDSDWFKKTSNKLLNSKETVCWHAKANLKKSYKGSPEYFHQDNTYRKSLGFKKKMLNCMVFIDDHSHLNGGLWIFPGSHKREYKHERFLNINSLQKNFINRKQLNQINKKHKVLSINEKKGSCIFFHNLLVHGSSHNISPFNRAILLYGITTKKNYEQANQKKISNLNVSKRIIFEANELNKRLKKISKYKKKYSS